MMFRTVPFRVRMAVYLSLAVFAAIALPTGCKPANAPLPTGAVNAVDAGLNANLQAAHAAVVQYEADVTAGKHTPAAGEKAIVNNLITALNTADPLYQSFHAALVANPNSGEPADLAAALAAVTANLTQLQALISGGK